MATQHLSERPLVLDRTDTEGKRRATNLPPECWLEPAPPLDLNGPTGVPYAPFDPGGVERPIFELFREVVEQSPDRIAVADNVRELSYRQIWNGACRLAQKITARAAIGQPVGVLLPNNAHYPVAVLGCLAATRPCVLLDRYYPAERNLAIIRDAGLAAIIVEASDRENEALYPRDIAAIAVDPETDRQSQLMWPSDGALPPDDPAVIVYTSGSTGEPKGIVLSQRAILHRAGQLINSLHLSAADRSLPLGSPCTIAGIQQVFEALLSGALLVKLDLQRVGFGAVLDTIRDRHVTLLFATPTLLRSLARLDGAGERLGSLRCVHPSGEVLLGADLDLLRRILPVSCEILVVYGLTEAPAICQWFVPRGIGEEDGARVAVGYILPGYDCVVLDQDDRPLGPEETGAETGELVVRSRYTALGEWQGGQPLPGRFRSDPADPSLRTLRTGDLVRVRSDGVVVVAGRKDRQVKIRGMRVEPYEVENVLRRAPGVLDAAVVAREGGESAMLVAFVVLQPAEPEQAIAALRARLRASLPAYMQPARIISVEALPLLPGHKLDVEVLLALDAARPGGAAAAAPAERRAQELVAQAWGEVLNRYAFAADIPFDQAGGDSLGLLRLVFELEAQCGVMLPLTAFDLSMRPSEFAQALDDILAGHPTAEPAALAEKEGARSSPLVLLRAGDRAPPVFMTHGLGGTVGHLAQLGRHIRSRHPLYGLQVDGDTTDRVEAVAQSFADSIEATQPTGPCLLIGMCFGGLIMFEVAQRLSQRGREIGLLALLDSDLPPRFWSLRVWIRFLVRRAMHHASSLIELAPSRVIPQLRHLCAEFIRHIRSRRSSSPNSRSAVGPAGPALRRLRGGLAAAGRRYRPRYYPGKLTFLKSEIVGPQAALDVTTAWRPLAKEIDIITVPGDHLSMILSEPLGAQLSNCLNRVLAGNG